MVEAYLRQEISLSELDRWIIDNLGFFLAEPRDSSSDLAGAIQRWLAEMSHGHRAEREFRQLVEDHLRRQKTVVLSLGENFLTATSSNSNVSGPALGITPQEEVQVLSFSHRQF